jgi:hypothetical protein
MAASTGPLFLVKCSFTVVVTLLKNEMMQECILRHFKVFVEGRRGSSTLFKKNGRKWIAVVLREGADETRGEPLIL